VQGLEVWESDLAPQPEQLQAFNTCCCWHVGQAWTCVSAAPDGRVSEARMET
jgi:hypothetical protein